MMVATVSKLMQFVVLGITIAITGSKNWRDEGATPLAVRVNGVG
jgi:hypothetical protein